MTISAKGKRRLTVGGREFLWWVAEDEEWQHALSVRLLSVDGRVSLKMALDAQPDNYVVTLGSEFRGREMVQGQHQRLLYPREASAGPMTPGEVARLAAWATETDAQAEAVARRKG